MISTDISLYKSQPLLALGTANFGSNYGINNSVGILTDSQVEEMLQLSAILGIDKLDTASGYGRAEELIGNYWPTNLSVNVMTKLSSANCADSETFFDTVKNSLALSKQGSLWAVLLHDSSILLNDGSKNLIHDLRQLLDSGATKHIGISAYTEKEIIQAKEIIPEMDFFQISNNICDQRLHSSSAFQKMFDNGDIFFVRSIFLQGLLLMNPNNLPSRMNAAKFILEQFREFCISNEVSLIDACLGYAKSIPWASGIVVGAESVNQIKEINDSIQSTINVDYSKAPRLSDWFLDPRNWS